MTLRKITIDNSVRYIPVGEKTKERDIKPKTKTIKAGSLPRKQNKNLSQNSKKNLKIYQQVDLEYLQNSMYMYKNICIIIRI